MTFENTPRLAVPYAAASRVPKEGLHPDSRAEDVRAELRRVLESPQFDASERNRRFLRHVVEETLAGRAGRIKAYSVATTVFGRDSDFDPQLDPVVRMEAQRLRRSLERFYLTEGRASPVRILMPKGAYVPEFRSGDPAAAPSAEENPAALPPESRLPAITIGPFETESGQPAGACQERGLVYQLMIGLCRTKAFRVLCPVPDAGADMVPAAGQFRSRGEADGLVLTGCIAVSSGRMQVKAVLIEAATLLVVWGRSFEQPTEAHGPLHARDAIANAIVQAVQRPGLTLQYEAARYGNLPRSP